MLISRFPQMKSWPSPTTLSCHFSQNSGETTTRMWSWRQKLAAYQQMKKELLDHYGSVGCHSSRSNDLSVHARIDPSRIFSPVMGNRWWHKWTCSTLRGQVCQKDRKNNHRIARAIGWAAPWHFAACCVCCGKQRPRYHRGLLWAYSKMHQWRQEEATGDQIWSSKIKVCMPSPPQVGNEVTCCSTFFQNSTSTNVSL